MNIAAIGMFTCGSLLVFGGCFWAIYTALKEQMWFLLMFVPFWMSMWFFMYGTMVEI